MSGRATREALLDRASELLRSGRLPQAIEAHERLLAAHPDLADSWYNLAYLQHQARRYEAALESYRRALACGIGSPEEVHLNRAVILAGHLARGEEAFAELAQALALNERYLPALVNLGNLHEQRGDRAAARDAYERALAINPDNALALARLPDLKPLRDAGDPLIVRLREAIARPGASAAERADLGFGLGKALDGVAAYDDAFAAYAAANRASRESAGALGRYDRAAQERFVDRLIRAFPKPAPAPSTAGTSPGGRSPPLFICGMFRSGSTLIEQILASHPRVTAGGEIDLLPAIARAHLVPRGDSLAAIEGDMLARLRAAYLGGIGRLFPDADLVTDKRPDNFLSIGLIKTLFPDAKIVHTRRDPIDNCLSVFFLHLSPTMPYAFDLLDTAHWYHQYRRLMAHWQSVHGADIHSVDYDELVVDPRGVIGRLLDFCGLEWHDACLSFHKTRAAVMTPSAWQVREPLYTRSSGRWRHYARHLGALREALAAPPD